MQLYKYQSGHLDGRTEKAINKMRIKWCLDFLAADFDVMTQEDLYEISSGYTDLIVPRDESRSIWLMPNIEDSNESLKHLRLVLKDYQSIANDLISEVKAMVTGQTISIAVEKRVAFHLDNESHFSIQQKTDDLYFKYNFAVCIATILDGRSFADTFKHCPVCGLLFARQTKHKKEYCSNKCAVQGSRRTPAYKELHRAEQPYYYLKKRGIGNEAIKNCYKKKINDGNIKLEHIPPGIKRKLNLDI